MKNKHELYLHLAEIIGQESYCQRSKVGAILEKDGNIIAFGYNGTPRGFDNKCEMEDMTKPEVLHAESNAILKCAKSTASSENSILYVTVSPCFECAKLIIQAGISRVFYRHEYRDLAGLELLTTAGIPYQKL